MAFLKQYGVIGLAIAVIIGGKANAPGSVHFLLGPVLGAAVDFLIVAWLVFWFSKKMLKEESVTKK